MNNPRPLIQIRSRKLGVLLYDSRLYARRSIEECAAAIAVPPEAYQTFENGTSSPSLPQIELLSIYLNIPLEHFWGRQALSTAVSAPPLDENERILNLRNRVIGASLRMARSNKSLGLADLSAQIGISPEQLQQYELGTKTIPLPELEVLAAALDTPLASFYDQHGPIGRRRAQQGTAQVLLDLPPELQEFVVKPVNRPYLEIAQRLSDLPVEKLRALAESLLEITF